MDGPVPDTVVERLLESVQRHAHVDVGYLTEYDPEVTTIRAASGHTDGLGVDVGRRVPDEDSLCLASVSGAIPPLVPDTQRERRVRRRVERAGLDVGAFAATPIRLADGTLWGALCIANRDPLPDLGAPTQQLLAVVADVLADQLGHEAAVLEDLDRNRREVLDLMAPGHMSTLLQPIVGLRQGNTIGVEALTRFTRPPIRPPDLWFARAARLGVATQLELAAIERALALLDRVPARWHVAVNAAPAVLATGGVARLLDRADASRVVVEVTEHAEVDDYDRVGAALDDLRRMGVRIAVDDVGAGFSSFRHVLNLRPDILKVDRSLVRGCDGDGMRRAMVESIVGFARRARATVVAEAVETPTELATLQALGVDAAQGYLFAAPSDPEDLRVGYPVHAPSSLVG